LGQILELILKNVPTDQMSRSLLIIPINYAMFLPDKQSGPAPQVGRTGVLARGSGFTDVEMESWRFSPAMDPNNLIFRSSPSWLVRFIQGNLFYLLPAATQLPPRSSDPLLSLRIWRWTLLQPDPTSTTTNPASKALTAVEQMHWISDRMHSYLGTLSPNLPDEQFDTLENLIAKARVNGFDVIVVILPLPSWHSQASEYYTAFRRQMSKRSGKMREKGATILDLVDAIPDSDFRDSVHPEPAAVDRWVNALVQALPAINSRENN